MRFIKMISRFSIILLLSIILTGCSGNNSLENLSDREKLFDCFETVLEDSSCSEQSSRETLDNGLKDYINDGGYTNIGRISEAYIRVGLTENTVFINVFLSNESEDFSKVHFVNIFELFEEMYEDISNLETDINFRLCVRYTNTFDDSRLERFVLVKSSYEDQAEIEVIYDIGAFSLITVSSEKELLATVLNNSDEFDISVTLTALDTSIEDYTKNFLHFSFLLDKGETEIAYQFTPETSLVELDFTYEDFFNTLLSEFPNYTYVLEE